LPQVMTKGLIALLFKSGEREDLGNWWPITLLNTSYKILAKTLQLRLKPLLVEVIDSDQTTFFPTRFILDNVLVTNGTIEHARSSQQTLILLKLDFCKAFDRVEWRFLFECMSRFGIHPRFLDLVKLLFSGVAAGVSVNGGQSIKFQIKRGVRQGCPLAPYLFLLVQEVLNLVVKNAEAKGKIKGIRLPDSEKTQLISQFVDDTSFILDASNREQVINLVEILNCFKRVSGLEINWSKSLAY
jgi:hypothetical protein